MSCVIQRDSIRNVCCCSKHCKGDAKADGNTDLVKHYNYNTDLHFMVHSIPNVLVLLFNLCKGLEARMNWWYKKDTMKYI